MSSAGATYEIFYKTPEWSDLSVLEGVIRFRSIQVLNRVGYFSVDIHRDAFPNNLSVDSFIQINRKPVGEENSRLFTGFLRRIRKGQTFISLSGFDLNFLLTTRIVAYAAESDQALKTGASDDILKAIMRENFGSSATDTSRDLSSRLTIEADTSQGNTITKGFSWKPVFDVFVEITDDEKEAGSPLYWTLVERDADQDIYFQTFSAQPGVDRTVGTGANPLIFGPGYGNLDNPILDTDYGSTWNYVYVGGQGEGDNRTVTEVSNSSRIALSPWNRRERFRDARNTEAGGLTTIGNSELKLGRPRRTFSGKIQSTEQARLGPDWGLGDRITMEFDGDTFDGIISQLAIAVDDSGFETIDTEVELDE